MARPAIRFDGITTAVVPWRFRGVISERVQGVGHNRAVSAAALVNSFNVHKPKRLRHDNNSIAKIYTNSYSLFDKVSIAKKAHGSEILISDLILGNPIAEDASLFNLVQASSPTINDINSLGPNQSGFQLSSAKLKTEKQWLATLPPSLANGFFTLRPITPGLTATDMAVTSDKSGDSMTRKGLLVSV
jgi:hypothetical protein